SWGWWIDQGATSLWETWQGPDSRNHIMFGDICAWFYKALAGINPDPAGPGFKRFIIRPNIVGDLTHASAVYDSPRGRIAVRWTIEATKLVMFVSIPVNTTATVYIPATKQSDVGVADGFAFAHFQRMEGGAAVYSVASGFYQFTSSIGRRRLPLPR